MNHYSNCNRIKLFIFRLKINLFTISIILIACINQNQTKRINSSSSLFHWDKKAVNEKEFIEADFAKIPFDTSKMPISLKLGNHHVKLIPFCKTNNGDSMNYDSSGTTYLGYGYQNFRQLFALSEETPSWSFHYLYHTNNGVIDSIIGKPKFYKNRIISFLDWVTDCNHEISIWDYTGNRLKQIISFDWQREVDPNGTQWLLDVAYVNDSTFITQSHTRDNHYTDTLYYRFTRNRK